jgi:hypothetical protein
MCSLHWIENKLKKKSIDRTFLLIVNCFSFYADCLQFEYPVCMHVNLDQYGTFWIDLNIGKYDVHQYRFCFDLVDDVCDYRNQIGQVIYQLDD